MLHWGVKNDKISCNAASSHIVINDFHQMNYVMITQGQFTINNNLSPVFLYLPRAGLISLSCLCCPRQGGSCMGKYTRQPATGNRLQISPKYFQWNQFILAGRGHSRLKIRNMPHCEDAFISGFKHVFYLRLMCDATCPLAPAWPRLHRHQVITSGPARQQRQCAGGWSRYNVIIMIHSCLLLLHHSRQPAGGWSHSKPPAAAVDPMLHGKS